jgi:hypothetical protein
VTSEQRSTISTFGLTHVIGASDLGVCGDR